MPRANEFKEEEIDEMLEDLSAPWDKLPVESDLQYRAFREFFCRVPARERSVVKAYDKYLVAQGKPKAARANTSWYEWYGTFKWLERAEAYDNFLAEETKNYVKHEQYQELIDFRRRQRDLAGMITDSASLMIDKALEALKKLNAKEITPRMIPEYIKTAAQVAELAQNAEANAMALNEIVDRLGIEEEERAIEIVEMDEDGKVLAGVEIDNETAVLVDLLNDIDGDDGETEY